MIAVPPQTYYHCNRYSAESACEHCHAVVHHASWCITRNPRVLYGYEVIMDPTQLTLQDRLILHALGVAWSACAGGCGNRPT